MARPSIDEDCKTFLSALRRKDVVGNITLRSQLGWREERYWKVHQSLCENGRIVRGRGKGGSVARATR
jgi:type I restriction enzyme M protein